MGQEKKEPISNDSRESKTTEGFSEKTLCDLRLLSVQRLVFFRAGSRERNFLISLKGKNKPRGSGRTPRG
jgi:hypothetical protein